MFFDMEAGGFCLDVSSLHLYDAFTSPGGKVSFQQVFTRFEAGIDAVPMLRRKLVTVPLGLDHPYWIDDPDFDLANHLVEVKLPAPGNWQQLMDVTSELFTRKIGRDKPLWFGAIITGINDVEDLPKNSYAMFLKMHHAAIDGASGRKLQEAIHDLEPKRVSKAARKPRAVSQEDIPSGLSLLARAYPNNIRKSARAARAAIHALPGIAVDLGKGVIESARDLPQTIRDLQDGLETARLATSLNPEEPGEDLRVDGRVFPLDGIKSIRALYDGATVNDVVFAIIGGGIRRYLDEVDEVPDVPLTVGMPVDVRTESDEDATVMVMISMTRLFTNIDDPVERIRASHESNVAGKESPTIRRARPMLEVVQHMPLMLTSPLIRSVAKLAGKSKVVAAHTLITNVPGIPRPVFLAGGRMTAMMGMAPVAARTGATHGVFSTVDSLTIAVTCGSKVISDTNLYMDCMQASYDEYISLLGKPAAKKRSGRAKRA